MPARLACLLLVLASAAPAAAQFIPYYGKNKVAYDTFAWRVYKSPHFEVYYYPEFEQHGKKCASPSAGCTATKTKSPTG